MNVSRLALNTASSWLRISVAMSVVCLASCDAISPASPHPDLQTDADAARVMQRLGDDLRQSGDLESARQMYRGAARANSRTAGPLAKLGELSLSAGESANAEATFRGALERSPGDATATAGLAAALLSEGRPSEAMALVGGRVGESPRMARLAGVSFDMLGRAPEAQSAYRRGLQADPSDEALRRNLALSLAASGDMKTAELEIRLVLAQGSQQSTQGALGNAIIILALAGKEDEARRLGEKELGAGRVDALLRRANEVRAETTPARRALKLGILHERGADRPAG